MTKHMIRFVAVAILGFALAPAANADIVAITSVTTSGSIDLDSFTAGGTLYTTATDLSLGTSVKTDSSALDGRVIGNQDNFDLNLIFSRGANAGDNAWNTSLFGGANWSDSNGSAADFFIFEANGNDTLNVAPIFTDDSVGQYVTIASSGVNWGSTGVTVTGPVRNGDTIFGVAFAITDLKDAGGVALTNSTVIKGLAFDAPNTDIASISAVPAPETDPAITSKNPADDTLNVAIHANLVATFDENIALVDGGTITIRDLGAGSDTVITLPDAQVTVSGAVLTINPTDNLLPGNAYAVRISDDAVEDLATAPNAFAGIFDDTTWNFDTWVAGADSVLWQQFKTAIITGTEPTLPDYSYAGYDYSESSIPDTSGWTVFDVTDYGAVADDSGFDDAAIQAAIDAAELAGGGVVFFPPGQFKVSPNETVGENIFLNGSNIVLKGSGSSTGGTEIFKVNKKVNNGRYIFEVKPPSTDDSTLTTVVADAPRESFDIEVASASGLSVGQRIVLRTKSIPYAQAYFAPQALQTTWTRIESETGFSMQEIHTVAAINGTTITFREPLHLPLIMSYNGESISIEVRNYPVITDVGVEDILFKGNWDSYPEDFSHHKDDIHDYAWNAIRFDNVANGWLRNCEFKDWNQSIFFDGCAAFTVDNVQLTGKKGHASIHTRKCYGVLVKDCSDTAGHHHGCGVGYWNTGTVYLRYDMAGNQSMDAHSGSPYATLFDNVTGVNFDGNGGPHESYPHHAKYFVAWNVTVSGGPSNYNFWQASRNGHTFAMPYFIGCSPMSITAGTFAANESPGTPVEPASLFDAQLAFRLSLGLVLESLSPADDSTEVPVNANLVATFDENIALTGSGTVTIRDLGAGPDTVITLPDAQVTVSGAVLTINPTANLLPDNAYAVRISDDAVEDLATNAFAGILDDTTWNFDTAAPAVAIAGVTVVDIGVDAYTYPNGRTQGYSDWNTSLTLDASGNAYAVFVDSNRKNTVAKVTPGGVVTTQIIDTANNNLDLGHNTPSIAIDGDGYLHVAYNMHNHNMTLRKSPAANSVSGTWVDEGGTGSPWGAGRFTYPAMSTAPNGDVYMSIRNREIGGPVQLFHYDNTTDSWSSIAKFADQDGYTAYLPAPYVDESGKVHLSWHWQQGSPGAERQRGSYAVYDPSDDDPIDDSFSKADGTAYIIPITTTTAELYQPSEADWGVKQIADHSLTVNALGQPIIAYNFFREGDNDQRVLRLSRWDDLASAWQRTDLEGPVTGTTLGDPVIVNRNGTLHIYYNDADGKLTLRSSADNGLTFGDAITLTDHAVKAAHVLIGGTSIGSNQEAIFFLDPSDNHAAKVMFVDYAQVADADSDGLLDSWELSFSGIVELTDLTGLKSGPGPGADTGDFDGDGYSDLDEFRLGLIPSDPNSTFKLDVSPDPDGTVELSWASQEGLQFEIYFTDDLSLPLANWSVTSPITDDDGDGAPTHEWTDEDAASHPRRFYRVGLLP